MLRKRNGQSILEYVIVLTAIIAVIILAATNVIRPAVEKAMNDAADTIKTATGKLPMAAPEVETPIVQLPE